MSTAPSSLVDRLGVALFSSLVSAIQLPLGIAIFGFLISGPVALPIMGFWFLMGWCPPSHEQSIVVYRGIGWCLVAASGVGFINAIWCSLRGRDNWLFAFALTQDRWDKPS